MKKIAFISMILCFFAANAQDMGNATYNNRRNNAASSYYNRATIINDSVMQIEVSVLMNIKAEKYVMIFALSQNASSIDECTQLINQRIYTFVDSLIGLGISRKDVYVDQISQVPRYEYEVEKKLFSKTYNEVPSGFEVKKNIHIPVADSKICSEVLIRAAKFEIYDYVKTDYIVENFEPIYDSLRHAAIRIMNKKVMDFEKLGFKPNKLKYHIISDEITSYTPTEKYNSYTAFSSTTTSLDRRSSAGKLTYAPKNVTYYYDREAYSIFDLVINPVVVEPAVQFVYFLRMRYAMKK